MAERTALIVENCQRRELFESLRNDLAQVGAFVNRPNSSAVELIDNDGTSAEATLDELVCRLGGTLEVQFQWWFAEDESLYCRFRSVTGASNVVDLGMEGCDPEKLTGIGRVLRSRFLRESSAVGYVFDPEGVGEDCDWGTFFLRRDTFDLSCARGAFPAAVGVAEDDMGRLLNVPSHVCLAHSAGRVVLGS